MAGTSLLTHRLGVGGPGYKVHCRSYAGPASYATGGFAVDFATDMSLTGSIALAQVTSDSGYIGSYDASAAKIKSHTSGGTETTATTNLSGVTFNVLLVEQL